MTSEATQQNTHLFDSKTTTVLVIQFITHIPEIKPVVAVLGRICVSVTIFGLPRPDPFCTVVRPVLLAWMV